jgi:hypothetical protein
LLTPHQLSLSLSLTSAPAADYNIQPSTTSTSATSALSFLVSTTISEFILWITNLRKRTNFIQLQILKQYIKLEDRNFIID